MGSEEDDNRSLPLPPPSPSNENPNHPLTLLDQGSPEDAKLSFEPDDDDLNGRTTATASASSIASATAAAAYDPFAPETVIYHHNNIKSSNPTGHHHTASASAVEASVSESSPRATASSSGPGRFLAAASVGAYSYHPLPPPLRAGDRGLLLHEPAAATATAVSTAAPPNDVSYEYDHDTAGVAVAVAVTASAASNKPPPAPPPPLQQQHHQQHVAYGAWPGTVAPVRYMMPASQQQQHHQQQQQQYGRMSMPMHLQHPHAHAPVIYHGSMQHHLHNEHVMMTGMYDPALMRPAGVAAVAAPPPSARYYYHPDHEIMYPPHAIPPRPGDYEEEEQQQQLHEEEQPDHDILPPSQIGRVRDRSARPRSSSSAEPDHLQHGRAVRVRTHDQHHHHLSHHDHHLHHHASSKQSFKRGSSTGKRGSAPSTLSSTTTTTLPFKKSKKSHNNNNNYNNNTSEDDEEGNDDEDDYSNDSKGLPQPGRTYTPDQQSRWDEMYSRLVKFKERHGHTRVPESYEDTKLANWVGNQRRAMSRQQRGLPYRRFDQRRIALLDAIGFEWARARANKPGSYDKRSWDEMFQSLIQFKETYGHTRVPANFDNRLANWVSNQRTAMSRKKRGLPYRCLNDHKIKLLDSINFAWVATRSSQQQDPPSQEGVEDKSEM